MLRRTVGGLALLCAAGSRSASAASEPRRPLSGASWREIFLNQDLASHCSCGEAIHQGHSVLLLQQVATADECESLRLEGSTIASAERNQRGSQLIPDPLYPFPGLCKLPVTEKLHESGQHLCDVLLRRSLALAEQHIPGLSATLFGCIIDDPSNNNANLSWSAGEPAVNVYTEGGRFKPHKDKQTLTIIMPLVDSGVAFTGGGTAFWSLEDCGSTMSWMSFLRRMLFNVVEDVIIEKPPTMVLTPPAGTALFWTGQVTHAGQPVVDGERCVLVASFSPTASESLISDQEFDG